MVKNFSSRSFTEQLKKNTEEEIEKMKMNFWITSDPKEFEHLYNLLLYYRGVVKGYSDFLRELKSTGARLIVLIKKEYQLK